MKNRLIFFFAFILVFYFLSIRISGCNSLNTVHIIKYHSSVSLLILKLRKKYLIDYKFINIVFICPLALPNIRGLSKNVLLYGPLRFHWLYPLKGGSSAGALGERPPVLNSWIRHCPSLLKDQGLWGCNSSPVMVTFTYKRSIFK